VEEKPIEKTVRDEDDIIVKKAETTAQKTAEITDKTTDTIVATTQEAIKTPTPHTEPAAVETPTVGITKIDSTVTAKEETPINIADTKAVEEAVKTPEPVKEEEPKDEYARLKARLDKVVYAGENAAKEAKETTTVTEKKASSETASAPSETTTKPVYYTVKKGDNAFGIAKKHHITMAQLKAWNQLDFSEIKVGQKLRVK
jgi:LysM repeat protein